MGRSLGIDTPCHDLAQALRWQIKCPELYVLAGHEACRTSGNDVSILINEE
jgi:hypothetical protein